MIVNLPVLFLLQVDQSFDLELTRPWQTLLSIDPHVIVSNYSLNSQFRVNESNFKGGGKYILLESSANQF